MAKFISIGTNQWINMDEVLKVSRWVAAENSLAVRRGDADPGEVVYTLYFGVEHHFYKGEEGDDRYRLELSDASGYDHTELEEYLGLPPEQRPEIPGIKSNKGPL